MLSFLVVIVEFNEPYSNGGVILDVAASAVERPIDTLT